MLSIIPEKELHLREKLKSNIKSKGMNILESKKSYDFIKDCYSSSDLESGPKTLFHLIEEEYFKGSLLECIEATDLTFEVMYNNRLSSSGGRTIISKSRNLIKIELSSQLLKNLQKSDKKIKVCGWRCEDIIDAEIRIMEHEIIHLVELLCFENSSCNQLRFQTLSRKYFDHRDFKHELITSKELLLNDLNLKMNQKIIFTQEDGSKKEGVLIGITKTHGKIFVFSSSGNYRLKSSPGRGVIIKVPLSTLVL